MKIIINGAGIAGQTLAYWLARYGYEPTLVEQAPRLRTGGYVVDFWGTGFDVADKMGLIPNLMSTGYAVEEMRLVDSHGTRTGGFSTEVFQEIANGRYVSLPRSDLAAAIYGEIDGEVEIIFSDSLARIVEDETGVRVEFDHGPARKFDLAIGADGLHSRVRGLMFSDQERFERYLGYQVVAFEAERYQPRDELVYVCYNRPGMQVARFAMRENRTLFLLVYSDDRSNPANSGGLRGQKDVLHARFDDAGWECPQIMAAMEACDSIYFDRVSQIRMERWTVGRLALVGDAAFCPSLLAGEGAGLAMTAAYVLAGELCRASGNHLEGFAAYECILRPFIAGKQKSAESFAKAFAPRTALGLWFRSQMFKAMSIRIIAELTIGRSFLNKIALPDYTMPRAN